jgi:3-dehydroquinate synthase
MSSKNVITYIPHPIVFDSFDFFVNEIELSKTLFIIDKKVFELYHLNDLEINYFIIESNEENKSIFTAAEIIDKLVDLKFDKGANLVGIGGGIVCDVTGFAASIYKRGIKHYFVPTTLLAMVDASIGGKTAVNYQKIKNLIGTFNFPEMVTISTDFLKTLDDKELINGFMEVIKIFIACNKSGFYLIHSVKNWNRENLTNIKLIEEAIKLKCEVVVKDKFDENVRKILNFGHTFGHAIESVYGLKHGIAVAHGMMIASYLSYKLQYLNFAIYIEIMELLKNIKVNFNHKFDLESLLTFMMHDKKANNGKIEFVLLHDIGDPFVTQLYITEFKELVNDLPQFRK